MSVNAREEQYKHVELFGKSALCTNSRIDRGTVPEGFHCYDLRGSDYDSGKPTTLENQVAVNHAGTVLTVKPVTIPKEGFRRLRGKLNFLAECLTLTEFCEEHGIALPPDNRKFILWPASPNEAGFFYALPKEQDAALGAIGHVRIDFGCGGDEFWHTWHPRGDKSLNSPEFKVKLTELVNELRETGPLKNLSTMVDYCGNHGGEIKGGWRHNYGYVIETERYRYCLGCNPGPGDYHAYLTAFDLRAQRMNIKQESPEQKHGPTEAGKELLRNAADNTRSHSYSWFVFQDYNTPGEKFTGGLMLPEAIRLYNEIGSGSKWLGVTKDGIAAVDLERTAAAGRLHTTRQLLRRSGYRGIDGNAARCYHRTDARTGYYDGRFINETESRMGEIYEGAVSARNSRPAHGDARSLRPGAFRHRGNR